MNEIEIKFKITDAQAVIDKFKVSGANFGPVIEQTDTIYIPSSEKTLPVAAGVNVLRIRRDGEKNIFTLKQSTSDSNLYLSKIEKETEIADPQIMMEAIQLLGFHQICVVHKKRQKCKFEGYEICVDEVDGLGNFMEVEEITDKDPAIVRLEMLEFLSRHGIEAGERVNQGYDVMMVKGLEK